MGLCGTVALAYGFNCIEQVQVPGSFASAHSCYGYSVSSISARPAFVSCPQVQMSFTSKMAECCDMIQSCNPCSLGLRGQVHKKQPVSQGFHHLVHSRGVERKRGLSVCAAIAQSYIKEPDAEEILIESRKEDNAYEDQLPYGLYPYLMPKHVAIIMDGNSRWAEQRGLLATEGHKAGRRALAEIIKLSCKWGIEILTVFAFSNDNWLRPKTEVRYLMDLFQLVLKDELETFKRENIRLCVIGDLARLPNSLQTLIVEAEETTKHNSRLNLIIALSYSGRNDILQACRRLAGQVEDGNLKSTDITESLFEEELETSCGGGFGSPDLLIRTSGEQRLSNFLLWQLAYTELFFDDSFWPEFGEVQYAEALRSFQHRHRRYGKRVCSKTKGTINF